MSEYWKSTPKYWCKFCASYVKDTKFERQQHEATGRHQGAVQRSLRTLHKEHDKEERDKQRAKDEVARLNGVVSGKPVLSSAYKPITTQGPTSQPSSNPEERKRQLKQLADLGVAVPEGFRKDMAMAGEWQTTSIRRIEEGKEDVKPDVKSFGVRKRKLDEEEEEEHELAAVAKRKGWGTAVRAYPGDSPEAEDIEALLQSATSKTSDTPAVQTERQSGMTMETTQENLSGSTNVTNGTEDPGLKPEDGPTATPVVFKKRKGKILKT